MESGRPEEGAGNGAGPSGESGTTGGLARALARALESRGAAAAPARLSRICVDLLDVTGASVSLGGQAPGIEALWCSSDPVAALLAETQYSLGDGPCRTARALPAPVFAEDLAAGDARRWPLFAQRAVELGVRAVFSLPLGGDTVTIGSLDLYRTAPGPLGRRDTAGALTVGHAITLALMRARPRPGRPGEPEGPGGPASWLDDAESGHEEVHRATGVLMARLRVEPWDALSRLRAHAFARGQTVTEVARELVAGRVTLEE